MKKGQYTVLTTEQLEALQRYSHKGVSLKKVTREYDINYHAAYSHVSRHGLSYKGISLHWTPEMLRRVKDEFPVRFNRELAKELGMSPRSLIRKARELGVDKEPGFLEKHREQITEMAAAHHPKLTANHAGLPEAWIRAQFKPGVGCPPEHRHKIDMKAIQKKRAETVKMERLRIKYGLPRKTKLKLKST